MRGSVFARERIACGPHAAADRYLARFRSAASPAEASSRLKRSSSRRRAARRGSRRGSSWCSEASRTARKNHRCSADPRRTSHRIARYLQRAGYRILPVNPNYEEVLGEPCYPDLQHIPKETQLDIVNIFRRSAHTADMVRQVVQWQAETGQTPVVWTQLGVSSPEAERLARQAGLPYVKNRCIAVEHGRLVD
ncbi:MAG: hypothetical protein KatS3mg043_0530 [Rhodothermaceae bacterium]|nr:MAG: hypothetical protein KatS3mg043_0530 [Rhodothermaceae bacterium]